MKATLYAPFVGLLMFGCGDSAEPDELILLETIESSKAIDLDDKQTLGKILDEAIDLANLELRGEKAKSCEMNSFRIVLLLILRMISGRWHSMDLSSAVELRD